MADGAQWQPSRCANDIGAGVFVLHVAAYVLRAPPLRLPAGFPMAERGLRARPRTRNTQYPTWRGVAATKGLQAVGWVSLPVTNDK